MDQKSRDLRRLQWSAQYEIARPGYDDVMVTCPKFQDTEHGHQSLLA